MKSTERRTAVPVSKQSQSPSVAPPASNQTVQPRLLRVHEAARYLGATPWFVRSLIWSHQVPFLLFGKRHLIDVADLDVFIERQKAAA